MDMTREHFAATFQLSQNAATPIYTQLSEYLKYQIQSGVLKPVDKMICKMAWLICLVSAGQPLGSL